jgi:hypothetical protein
VIIFLKSFLLYHFEKEAKKSQKIERSQTEFLVAKQSQKKPKSRNLGFLAPNWQHWTRPLFQITVCH